MSEKKAHDKTVLIIDDEIKLRTLLSKIIQLEGFTVLEAEDCKSGIKKLSSTPIDAVLCDVKLPDGNGVDLTLQIKQKYPEIEIILLTAYGNIPDGVQAIKNGAFDYLIKGDDNNKVIPILNRAFEKIELIKKVSRLHKKINEKFSFENIIGTSTEIRKAIQLAQKVANTDTTVLLTGETGTGKEVFAQAIHYESHRKDQSIISINCSALGKELLESEMFGHQAGSFTGAVKEKKGLFEEANNGTIFLDEIGEMALDLQAKLLRVLETGEFYRIGATRPTKVNVRVLAATNRSLLKEIENGHFREDLFYRISVFQIELPPLRNRVADIPLLAMHFLRIYAGKTNKKITGMDPEYIAAICRHDWKGNIRELKNCIERSIILCEGDALKPEHLSSEIFFHTSQTNQEKTISAFELSSIEKLHIVKVLNYTQGNKTKCAELLGIALTTLYRKLDEYKIA